LHVAHPSYPGVTFTVTDGTAPISETITIAIGNTNRAPVLAPIGSKSGSEGSLLTFTISATDVDGDALTYSASGLPAGATFTTATATFSWTPGFDQAGTYSVIFMTSAEAPTPSGTLVITIANTNRAPVLSPIAIANANAPQRLAPFGTQRASEGSLLTFTVAATDADGDALTYSASGLPAGASFDPASKTFSWTPGFDQAGSYPGVTFTVTDG